MARLWQKLAALHKEGRWPLRAGQNVPPWHARRSTGGACSRESLIGVERTRKGSVMRFLMKLFRDKRGVGAIEYVLVASLISVAAIAAFDELGGSVDDKFGTVETSLQG